MPAQSLQIEYLNSQLSESQQRVLEVCEGIQTNLAPAFAGLPIKLERSDRVVNPTDVDLWVSSLQFKAPSGNFRGITTHRAAMWDEVITPFLRAAEEPLVHVAADEVGRIYKRTNPPGFFAHLAELAKQETGRDHLAILYQYLIDIDGPWKVLSTFSHVDTEARKMIYTAPLTGRQIDVRELPNAMLMNLGEPLYLTLNQAGH